MSNVSGIRINPTDWPRDKPININNNWFWSDKPPTIDRLPVDPKYTITMNEGAQICDARYRYSPSRLLNWFLGWETIGETMEGEWKPLLRTYMPVKDFFMCPTVKLEYAIARNAEAYSTANFTISD